MNHASAAASSPVPASKNVPVSPATITPPPSDTVTVQKSKSLVNVDILKGKQTVDGKHDGKNEAKVLKAIAVAERKKDKDVAAKGSDEAHTKIESEISSISKGNGAIASKSGLENKIESKSKAQSTVEGKSNVDTNAKGPSQDENSINDKSKIDRKVGGKSSEEHHADGKPLKVDGNTDRKPKEDNVQDQSKGGGDINGSSKADKQTKTEGIVDASVLEKAIPSSPTSKAAKQASSTQKNHKASKGKESQRSLPASPRASKGSSRAGSPIKDTERSQRQKGQNRERKGKPSVKKADKQSDWADSSNEGDPPSDLLYAAAAAAATATAGTAAVSPGSNGSGKSSDGTHSRNDRREVGGARGPDRGRYKNKKNGKLGRKTNNNKKASGAVGGHDAGGHTGAGSAGGKGPTSKKKLNPWAKTFGGPADQPPEGGRGDALAGGSARPPRKHNDAGGRGGRQARQQRSGYKHAGGGQADAGNGGGGGGETQTRHESTQAANGRGGGRLNPGAKEFTPGGAAVTEAYFVETQMVVDAGGQLAVHSAEAKKIAGEIGAVPGYWVVGGQNGTVIPGLEEFPPAELARAGKIKPVSWLPVE